MALLLVVVEYVARRFVAPSIPVLGERQVNESLCVGAVGAVVLIALAKRAPMPVADGRGWRWAARRWQVWVGAVLVPAALALTSIDGLVPSIDAPSPRASWGDTWWLRDVLWLGPVSLLLVEGVLTPIAEERLWRGFIQPRTSAGLGTTAGVGLMAVLFSAKYLVLDVSLGRALAVTGMGAVLGWVAGATTWRGSALVHATLRFLGTLLLVGMRPTCPWPPIESRPELQRAVDQAIAQMASPDDAALDAMFVPSYFVGFPSGRAPFRDARHEEGACSFQCTVKEDSPFTTTAMLRCAAGPHFMTIEIEDRPPGKVSRFTLRMARPR